MYVSPPNRGTLWWLHGLANLRECPMNYRSPPARVLSHSRADSFRRVSPGSGIVWLLCRAPLFRRTPLFASAQAGVILGITRSFLPSFPRRSMNMKMLYSALNLARKMVFSFAVTSTPAAM